MSHRAAPTLPLLPIQPIDRAPQRVITWRSVLLGLLGVVFICGLTPFNDFVVNNTYLVGNFLPIGLLLFFIVFVMLVNAPLHLLAPRHAFSPGELSVALGMTLVSCGLPSSGLMRYLPSTLVGLWNQTSNPDFRSLLSDMQLPAWMFPGTTSGDPLQWVSDPVNRHYMVRVPSQNDSFIARWLLVPWRSWVAPALSWGALLACLYGAILCMGILVRRQWVENERLAFPLASIYLSLIEAPEPGRALNALFRSRAFWIVAATVFVVHGFNAMSMYSPRYFPKIPVGYDLHSIFANEPWKFADTSFKKSTVFFCVIGIVYFLQSNIAFSLFFFYLLMQGVRMMFNSYGIEFTDARKGDLTFGALVPFAAAVLWVGRAHWAMIVRQMFRGETDGEPIGRYLSYRAAGWGFVLCLIGLVAWLCIAGMSVAGAVVLVLMLFLLILVLTRIVAETGLLFVQLPVPLTRPWVYLVGMVESPGVRTTIKSYFFTAWFHQLFAHDLRENVSVYATHAMRTADTAAYEDQPRRSRAIGFTFCLILALLVGYFTAGASMVYCEYTHSVTLDRVQAFPINSYGVEVVPRGTLQATIDYLPPGAGPKENHHRLGHFATGFGLTGMLAYLRLRFVAWPFHPIGFLLSTTYPIGMIWFSIMIGWMVKVLIVRFGGTDLYRAVRPMFIGMIIGEAGAAAFWLVVSLILVSTGQSYEAIKLLPQ